MIRGFKLEKSELNLMSRMRLKDQEKNKSSCMCRSTRGYDMPGQKHSYLYLQRLGS
jgi:hypothetical protein